jgi:hypothetical protein
MKLQSTYDEGALEDVMGASRLDRRPAARGPVWRMAMDMHNGLIRDMHSF